MRKLLIIGAGGFGKEVLWAALEMNRSFSELDRWEVVGFADDDGAKVGQDIRDIPVLGTPEEAMARFAGEPLWFHSATGNNRNREKLCRRLEANGGRAATIIHPASVISPYASIDEGTYVGALSVINPDAEIGRHVLINQRVAIGHDAVLEDYCQINPGGQINGQCRVGRHALIGSNASLHPSVEVGESAVVGANSQVLRDVLPRTTVNGVPATQTFPHQMQDPSPHKSTS